MEKYYKRVLCFVLAITVASISCFLGFNNSVAKASSPTSAVFDFSSEDDIDSWYYKEFSYNNPQVAVTNGELVGTLYTNRIAVVRFPVILQQGKKYNVSYDLRLENASSARVVAMYGKSSVDELSVDSHYINGGYYNTTASKKVEFSFTANISDGYDKFAIYMLANGAQNVVHIDNLKISMVNTEEGNYDFSSEADIDSWYYKEFSYNNPQVAVTNGELVGTLYTNRIAVVRFPVTLQQGKKYNVSYDLRLENAGSARVAAMYGKSSVDELDVDSHYINGNYYNTTDSKKVEFSFTANVSDGYDKFAIYMLANGAQNVVHIDNLKITENTLEEPEPIYVSLDFSDGSHISEMYAPDGVALENEAIKVQIATAYNYAKIKIPVKLEKGKTYSVKYKLKAAQFAWAVTILGAYAHESKSGYEVLKNSPTSDTKQVFNVQNLANLKQDEWNTVSYEFTADYADGYNYFGLFLQSGVTGTYYIDDLEIAEKIPGSESEEPEKVDVKFDFSEEKQVSAMYAPDGVALEDEAIKVYIATAYNYAKIKIPVKLEKGKTYSVKYKVKAAQFAWGVTLLGAYAHESKSGYEILKNSPTSDTKQVFSVKSLANLKQDEWNTVSYEFTADYADGYNYFGLFLQSGVIGDYYIDDLEVAEIEKDNEGEYKEVHEKFDFSSSEHVSAMYSPDDIEIVDEAIKLQIKKAYNYAKIRIPFKLKKGETYHVQFKIKAAQPAALVTILGAYAHESTSGYDILKNSPTSDTKHVFSIQNIPNFKKNKWKTVTYSFTADYADGYNYFGLFIQSYVLGTYYIDDLEITNKKDSPFKIEEEPSIKDYDFSNEDQLDYGQFITIENGELKCTFDKEWAAGKARFPFKLKNGKAYELTFKARSNIIDKTIHFWTAYALAVDNWDVIKNTDSKYVASKTYSRFYNDGWYDYKFTFIANSPEERYQYLGLFLQSTAAGEVWIDDMHIREVRLVDLKANYLGIDMEMDQVVAPVSGDIALPTTINKQFSVEGWYLDADLKQSVGFKLNTDKVSTSLYAKVKYNNEVVIDFEGENKDITISQSKSTTKKMIKEGNNTYLSFSVANAYDQLLMKTNYIWLPNRSYKLTMRYKFSGTVNMEMGLLRADYSGNSGPGFTQAVVYPMRDTFGICDWKELVIEFNTQDEKFEDAFKYIKMLVWFKEGTDAYLSLDDVVIQDLGVYKESDFKPNIDDYEWDEFKEDEALYSDWKNWQVLKVNSNGTYTPVEDKVDKKLPFNPIVLTAVGSIFIVAGVAVSVVVLKKKKLKK